MGLPKLWGKDSSGNRGFAFSHVKTIYYNWSSKKLLSTKLSEMDTATNNRILKSDISNVQVNNQNKVPSSALVYGMNNQISELNASAEKAEWKKLNHGDTVHLTRMGRYLLVFAHNTEQNSNGLYVASYYGDVNIAFPIREASNISMIYLENGDLRFTATATNPELYYCFLGV